MIIHSNFNYFREPSIAIRTKAMKCLSNIVEVDHSILARKDMQLGVAQKLLDTAISVREAAVDLIGKYILSDIELVDQYYEMLSVRILVRKLLILKIFSLDSFQLPDYLRFLKLLVKCCQIVELSQHYPWFIRGLFLAVELILELP